MSMWSDEDASDLFAMDDADSLPTGDIGLGLQHSVPSGWSPNDGYPDGTGSVRIWVDEDRHLTKVVVSNRWRDRARGTTLSSLFEEAFLLAQARLGIPRAVPSESPPRIPPLSWESLAEMRLRSLEIDEERARLDNLSDSQMRVSRWVGQATQGVSDNQMVTITLNIFGLTQSVQFDEAWVAQSRVSQICEGVMQAYRDASARHTPATYELGDREMLARRSRALRSTLLAMVKQGRGGQ